MKLIETFMVGPRHAGHSREIYVGHGMEMWHELIIPMNPFVPMTQRTELFVAALPSEAPVDAAFCGMQDKTYGDGQHPVIRWEGTNCLERAMAYIDTIKTVAA